MKKAKPDQDIELATDWPIHKVEETLAKSDGRSDLILFFKTRYSERYFAPIRVLEGIGKGAGFSIMTLACLLVETFYSYRAGLPTSHKGEYRGWLKQMNDRPKINTPDYVADSEFPTEIRDVFICFFTANQAFFPMVKGGEFYDNIRNGLLHQSQTKRGWKINTGTGCLWDENLRSLDRKLFVQKLRNYFEHYASELEEDDEVWKNARRKIWWLAQVSKSNL